MTAPTLNDIMAGLETRLATIPGLRHAAYAADTINPPHAELVVPDITSYRETMMRGTVYLPFRVFLFVSDAFDRPGQQALAAYASWTGTNSIPLAIEGDRKLGGIVDDCFVESFRNFHVDEVAMYKFYGGEFTVQVASPGV